MIEANLLFVDRGREVYLGPKSPFDGTKVPFQIFGIVEICEGPTGTSIRWDIDCATSESIDTAQRTIGKYRAPYILTYCKLGWASEIVADAGQASRKIRELMLLRGLQPSRTVIRKPNQAWFPAEFDPRSLSTPSDALLSRSVISSFDENLGICPLQFAGKDSLMNHLKTLEWFRPQNEEFPSENVEFERQVSDDYHHILSSGEGRIDTVLAAIQPKGDADPRWIAYKRIAAPIMHEGQSCVIALCIPTSINLKSMEWNAIETGLNHHRVRQLKF